MKILATTDGSARSLAVIPHAARLAQAIDGELVVLRILSPKLDCGDVHSPTLHEAAQVVAQRWSRESTDVLASMGVTGRVVVEARRHGEEVHDGILRLAAAEGVDFAAMSTRGAGVLRHAVLGSVALNVLARTPIGVLMAGEHAAPPVAAPYHLIVTSDGSKDAERAVEAVVPLSRHEHVKVTLLRIHVPRLGDRSDAVEAGAAADDLQRLRQQFPDPKAVGTAVRTIVRLGGVDTAILETATALGASAIAMSTHGHSAKHHVFMGSIALGVLGQSTLPLLLVRSAPAATP